jgi:hypothetical protein
MPIPYWALRLLVLLLWIFSLRQKVFRANLCTKDVPYCKMRNGEHHDYQGRGYFRGVTTQTQSGPQATAIFVTIHATLRLPVLFSKKLERYSRSYIHALGMAKLALDHYKWIQSTGLHYVPFYSCRPKRIDNQKNERSERWTLSSCTILVYRNRIRCLELESTLPIRSRWRSLSWTPVQGRRPSPTWGQALKAQSLTRPLPARLALTIYKSTSVVTSASYHVGC